MNSNRAPDTNDIKSSRHKDDPTSSGLYVKSGAGNTRRWSAQELQRGARSYSSNILARFRTLKAIADRHELTI